MMRTLLANNRNDFLIESYFSVNLCFLRVSVVKNLSIK